MKYLHALATVALITFLAVCSIGMFRLLDVANLDLWELHDVLTKADSAATATAQAANEEKSQVKQSMRELNKTLAKANDLVGHADVVLVGPDGRSGLAKSLNDSIEESTTLQKTAAKDLDDSFKAIDPALRDFTTSAAALSVNIPPIMSNLVDTTKNAGVSSANLAATTGAAQLTMLDIQKGVRYELEELEKPVKKVKVVGEELVRLAGRFLGY